MEKYLSKTLLIVMVGFMLIGCATQKQRPVTAQPSFEPYLFPADQYAQKVDNFMVILDASGTMAESYKGQSKFGLAKEVVSRMNQTIPDLKLKAGLRTFGQAFSKDTALKYGLRSYTKAELEGALRTVSWGGWTPLAGAITAASKDLESTRGDIAIIVVSDGIETEGSALSAAKDMKSKYGERVCIYSILIGDDPGGRSLLQQIAQASVCGFSVNAADILSSEDMGGFVSKVFLTGAADRDGDGVPDYLDQCPDTPKGAPVDAKGCPMDSDRDGVYDYLDKCPDTPKGAPVDANGCPLDSDGDGVYDYLDKCPDTPKGAPVDANGCPLDSDGDGVYDYLDKCPDTPKGAPVDARGCWVLKGVTFDTAKWDINPEGYSMLNEAVNILNDNPALRLEVQGHTDNRGSANYNKNLSEKRAKAVMDYMVEKGIEKNRLNAVGYGFSKPAAPNSTAEGRALNRRVELKPIP